MDYYFNKKAWMNTNIFEDYFKRFNQKMKNQGRKVLVILDNVSSHSKLNLIKEFALQKGVDELFSLYIKGENILNNKIKINQEQTFIKNYFKPMNK